MAKMKPPVQIVSPQISAIDGIKLPMQQVEKAEALFLSRTIAADDVSQWDLLIRNFIEKAFGQFSPNVASVTQVGKSGSFPMNADEDWWENHRAKTLQTKVSKLRGLVELLQTEAQLVGHEALPDPGPMAHAHRIFLVHGHNGGLLHEVARFLEKLHQEVIVLREQPSSGRTIIEKFVDYADVGYAVVLLTPDDRGGTVTTNFDSQRPRARQNVIFELGYFLGKLVRNRVTALYRADVEITSDYSGVAFVAVDDRGAWRLELAKELKAAGFNIDMNLAF